MIDRARIAFCCIALASACSTAHVHPEPAPTTTESTAPDPQSRQPEAMPPQTESPENDDDATREAWERCSEVTAQSTVTPPASIRDVDWCNHDYVPDLVGLRDGIGELHEYMDMGEAHDTHMWKLIEVVYGDVDRDGHEDAVVLLHSDNWAQGSSWSEADLYLFSVRGGAVVALGHAGASLVVQRTLTVGAGEVIMRYRRNAQTCVDRWTVANGVLTFDSSHCGP